MSDSLIASRVLFRFSAPLRKREPLWSEKNWQLGDEYRLAALTELDGGKPYAEVRAAWSREGLAFSAAVTGKHQPAWCRDSRIEDSDGLQVWIDTRDTHNVHRASRFCHRFGFMPGGAGKNFAEPVADQLIINRARENAKPVRPRLLKVTSTVTSTGYTLNALVPAEALDGFDPAEHPRLGFTYAVFDRELGLQTFSVGEGYPFDEDPSLWATLEMVQ